jgi:hypothetical protein
MLTLKTVKKIRTIKMMIHEAACGWDEPRGREDIHASDLFKDIEFCPREWAFSDMGLSRVKKHFIGAAQQITFDIGHDVEKRIRNDWLRKSVVGYWKCGVCGFTYPKWGKLPKVPCSRCGFSTQWTYNEVVVKHPESGVVGSIDAFVDTGEKKHRLLEIKTMDKDMHKKLIAPLAEHRYRTGLYLWLVEHSTLPEKERINTSQAYIIYMSKSYGFKDNSMKEAGITDVPFSPFKEYTIERQDDTIKIPMAKAKVLTRWRGMVKNEGSAGLPCGICINGLTKRAQSCPAISHCFSGNYLSSLTWLEDGKPRHSGKIVVE